MLKALLTKHALLLKTLLNKHRESELEKPRNLRGFLRLRGIESVLFVIQAF